MQIQARVEEADVLKVVHVLCENNNINFVTPSEVVRAAIRHIADKVILTKVQEEEARAKLIKIKRNVSIDATPPAEDFSEDLEELKKELGDEL